MTAATTSLPAEAASVPAARRFVRTTLTAMGLSAAWDAAEMLVSEVVTNGVIHARSQVTVSVLCTGDIVRISVTDLSPVMPRQRSYGTDSTTGRGLRLVATLAIAWGVEPDAGGKTVWFEVPTSGEASTPVQAWDDDVDVDALLAGFDDDLDDAPVTQLRTGRYQAQAEARVCSVTRSGGDPVTVHLLQFPVQVAARARQHHEELSREFELMHTGSSEAGRADVPARLLEMVEALTSRFAGVADEARERAEDAIDRGDTVIDDHIMVMPAAAAPACQALSAMLDEADEYCRQGQHLLTLATPPELVSYRHWYLGQIAAQISGDAPMPWPQYLARSGGTQAEA